MSTCLIELPLCAWRLRVGREPENGAKEVFGQSVLEHTEKPHITLAIATALFNAPAAAYGLARNFLAGNGLNSMGSGEHRWVNSRERQGGVHLGVAYGTVGLCNVVA